MTRRVACVADTSVWIDLHLGGSMDHAFALAIEWLIPDAVLAELEEPEGARVLALGGQRVSLPPDSVQGLEELAALYPGLATADLVALQLARLRGAMLLTSDAPLRRAAQREGVAVHGSLWLLDELVNERVLSEAEAARSLQQMVASGRRFPQGEVQSRLHRWRRAP